MRRASRSVGGGARGIRARRNPHPAGNPPHTRQLYTRAGSAIDPTGRAVIIVDDGTATGSSLLGDRIRERKPCRIVVALGVASTPHRSVTRLAVTFAVGLALADALSGRRQVTACFFGDGAVAEGEFHESLNLAALWKLPVLFACENNLYAMGTRIDRALSQTDVAAKARVYGIAAAAVDGMDVLAVERAARAAAERIREGAGPQFFSSSVCTDSARTRCSTPSCIATNRKSSCGSTAIRSAGCLRASRPKAHSIRRRGRAPTPRWTVTNLGDLGVESAFAVIYPPRAGRCGA